MSTIHILTKKGKIMKIKVMEDVAEVWARINNECGENFIFNPANKEFMFLTDKKGQSMIFHKRYCYKITV